MMRPVGRILVRKGKIAGLFLPIDGSLEEGLYEVSNVLGEITIKRIGNSAMHEARLNGIDVGEVFAERHESCITETEKKMSAIIPPGFIRVQP